jgi:hypothetical protein
MPYSAMRLAGACQPLQDALDAHCAQFSVDALLRQLIKHAVYSGGASREARGDHLGDRSARR